MLEKMSDSAKELFDLLYTKEFDVFRLRSELDSGRFSVDDVNIAAVEYVGECQENLMDDDWVAHYCGFGEIVPGLESSHITEVIELLLDYGLDPNRIIEDHYSGDRVDYYNIMDELKFIDNGYQAADSLYLLLSHGGNPNLVVGDESIPDGAFYDVWFDTNNRDDPGYPDERYDAFIHWFMVLVGFGAKLSSGKELMDRVGNFDLSFLKEHRDYYVGAIHSDKSEDGMELCFFYKHNNWEVARF